MFTSQYTKVKINNRTPPNVEVGGCRHSTTPNDLGCQLANTWPKITERDPHAMVRNGTERKNSRFYAVAATVEKASTYVFAERLIRIAEVRGSTPLCSTNRINDLGQGAHPAFFICHRFVTWSNRFGQIFNCSALRLISGVCVTKSHTNI